MAEEVKNTQAQEPDTNTQAKAEDNAVDEPKTPTVEELMSQLAQQKAENAKLKNASDKASREASEYKKQLRAKQTAEEQAEEARKEAEEQHNEYVASLENFQKQTLAKERYLAMGMNNDLATRAAEAEIKGDMDALVAIQKQDKESAVKAERAKMLAERPDVYAGVGGDEVITQEKFDAMSIQEKSKLYKENRAEYDRLMHKK